MRYFISICIVFISCGRAEFEIDYMKDAVNQSEVDFKIDVKSKEANDLYRSPGNMALRR